MDLLVLTQDLVRQPLGRLTVETVADLYALALVADQLPKSLQRDLEAFVPQKAREIRDLPDGTFIQDFLEEVASTPARLVPTTLREVVLGLVTREKLTAECAQILARLETAWGGTPPDPVVLKAKTAKRVEHIEAPFRLQTPARQEELRKKAATGGEPSTRTPRVPVSMKDQRRVDWIRETVTSRLVEYGDKGLKEAVLLAGLRHRSPFEDLTDAESLTELRAMKREGKVNFTAGRWVWAHRIIR